MLTVTRADLDRMTDGLYVDSRRKASRFWVLLVLAAVIAGAGLVASSDATVIGAMIVAPLMTPILAIALALVLADRRQLLRAALLVVGGAALVIVVGVLLAFLVHPVDDFAGNAQVAARTNPTLIDLVAALATGTVGAFALVRSDVSDTLPGVAIAISLVPPLVTVGLLLEVHRYHDAASALLLFGTNVAAIVATGTAVLLGYRVRTTALAAGFDVGRLRGVVLATVAVVVVALAVPLARTSYQIVDDELVRNEATVVAQRWAAAAGWHVESVEVQGGVVLVSALGLPPAAQPEQLRHDLDAAGLGDVDLRVTLDVGDVRSFASP